MAGVQEVLQAVQALHAHASPETTKQADEWLKVWQQSQQAWPVSYQILELDGQPVELTHLAAQTLRTKIQFDFCELPADAWNQLRDALMKYLLKYRGQEHSPIATQLCIAVADLAIQMDTAWPRVIPYLADRLATDPANLAIFLDILKSLPEENENRKLMTDHSKRQNTKQALLESVSDVLTLLTNIQTSQGSSPLAMAKVLGCFLAWLKFGSFGAQQLLGQQLLFCCFGYLEDPVLSEVATDVIVEVFKMISPEDVASWMPLVAVMMPQILALKPTVQNYLSTQQEDSVLPYVRIFTEMGEALTLMMIEEIGNPQVQELFSIEMAFTRFPSVELSQMPLEFWLRLLEHLRRGGGREARWKAYLPDAFQPIVQELLAVLIGAAKWPVDTDAFENDDFAEYRSRLRAVYDEGCVALGPSAALAFTLQSLQARQAEGVGIQEAHFFMLAGLVCRAEPEENCVLWDLMGSLPALIRQEMNGDTMLEVTKRTAIELVGNLHKWIRKREDVLRTCLDMLGHLLLSPPPQGLPAEDPRVTRFRHVQTAAAVAYCDLARGCKKELLPLTANLLQLNAQAASLTGRARLSVVEGTACIVVQLDGQQFQEALGAMIGPLVEMLEGSAAATEPLNDALDALQAIIRQVKCQENSPKEQAMGALVHQLWPRLRTLLGRFPGEGKIAEKCCRVVKHSMRCCPNQFKALVPSLGQTLVEAFRACKHSPYLYNAEIMASTYGTDESMHPALAEIHLHLTAIALEILMANVANLSEVTEVLEDFYGMTERYMRYCPQIVLQSQHLMQTLQLIPAAILVIQRDAIEAVLAFVTTFLLLASKTPAVAPQALELAPRIVEGLFRQILNVPPPYVTDQIPSELESIRYAFPNEYPGWVRESMRIFPPQVVPESEQASVFERISTAAGYRVSGCIWDIAYRSEQLALRSRNHKL